MYPHTLLLDLAESIDAAPFHGSTIHRVGELLRVLACTELRPLGVVVKLYDEARGDLDIAIELVGNGVRLVAKDPRGRLVWAGPVVVASKRVRVEKTLLLGMEASS